ncbi:GNAT family N-acetyltransferase [Peribacillus sp. SCS-155]|uniref:GNAT family N-acetyltransferase n=1 Tax=Peribacillus sedimenti TaxID=3115297 RepID=UPI00390697DC
MIIRKQHVTEERPMNLLLAADPSRSLVERYIERGDCFVAEKDHDIIGVYVLLQINIETAELINIAVSEHLQGQGIGKKLVQHAIQTAKTKGYKKLELGTGNSSLGQLALYQKCGFRITGVDKDFFIKNYEEEIFENGIQCRDMIRLSKDL